jgi:hypothetical protein
MKDLFPNPSAADFDGLPLLRRVISYSESPTDDYLPMCRSEGITPDESEWICQFNESAGDALNQNRALYKEYKVDGILVIQGYWAITGRLVGEDEDSAAIFGICTEAEAKQQFIDSMIAEEDEPIEDIRERIGLSPNDSCVRITTVVHSYSPIAIHDQT